MKKSLSLAVAALALFSATSAALSAPLLSVDVNARTSTDNPDSPPGYSLFTLNGTGAQSATSSQTIGAYTVTLTPFDDHQDEQTVTAGLQDTVGQLDDRDRATTGYASLSLAQIYDDFVFAGTSVGPTGGMNLTIAGGALLPNTQYSISLYSYDLSSGGNRSANWLDGNNANALVLSTLFAGGTPPANNSSYLFTGIATTDATGALLLLGRSTTPNLVSGAVNPGVFLNGFELNPIPEPASLSLLALTTPLLTRRRRT